MKIQVQNSRSHLIETFSEIKDKFDSIENNIKDREAKIKSGLKKIRLQVESDPWDKSKIDHSNQLKINTSADVEKIRSLIEQWIKDAENYDTCTKFRERFSDSLLVFVFGKVKAGKSSFGNYLAYGSSNPSKDIMQSVQPKPEFFWEEGNNSTETMSKTVMQEEPRFAVGCAETTSSIQGFRLPGITWVDSPGVHSTKKGNEDLTKKYADAADVFVFLSHSSEPGRRSDLKEIEHLLGQNKPLLIVLTASDSFEEDQDADGNIVKILRMKSDEDRKEQIDYMIEEMQKFNTEVKVISISIKYAESEILNADCASRIWRESGMKDFASELAKVSFSDGLKVKQTTPLKNLRKFCQGLMGDESIDSLKSIKALQKQLCGIATKIASERNDVRNLCKSVSGKIHSTLRTEIKKLADKHAETMNDTAFKDECMAEFSKNCKRYNIEIGEKFIHNFDGFHMKSLSAIPKFNNFSQHFEEKKFASKKSEKIGQAIGTGLGGIGAGALMGAEIGSIIPGAGTLIGGLIGAGIGAIFGGKVGKSIGENFNETETVKTHVGDNREDVANGVIEVLIESSNLYMNDVYTQLDNICFRDLEVWMEQLQSLLDDFYRTLENQINVINKELNYGAA